MVWQALEENYGGVERMRNQVFNQINDFEKLKKFDKDNTLRLKNLLLVIEDKFRDERGLIDHGGVLNAQIKKIIPPHELTNYFFKLAKEDRRDDFQALKKFMCMQRIAYKHSDINSTGTSRTIHLSEDLKRSTTLEIESDEAPEQHFDTFAGFTPKPEYKKSSLLNQKEIRNHGTLQRLMEIQNRNTLRKRMVIQNLHQSISEKLAIKPK